MNATDYLIAEAERMIRTHGFSEFSLSRLSDRVGVRKSSIQRLFRTRDDLTLAVVRVHASRLISALDTIEKRQIPTAAKLYAFRKFFAREDEAGQMSLCEAIAWRSAKNPQLARLEADLASIEMNWLVRIIEQGKAAGEIRKSADTGAEVQRVRRSLITRTPPAQCIRNSERRK